MVQRRAIIGAQATQQGGVSYLAGLCVAATPNHRTTTQNNNQTLVYYSNGSQTRDCSLHSPETHSPRESVAPCTHSRLPAACSSKEAKGTGMVRMVLVGGVPQACRTSVRCRQPHSKAGGWLTAETSTPTHLVRAGLVSSCRRHSTCPPLLLLHTHNQ